MSAGWIYLITDGEYTKIGITKNEVVKRNKQHQTGNARLIKTYYKFRVRDMHRVEKYLHKKYAEKHVHGEWFDLTDADLMSIVREFPDGEYGEAFMSFKRITKLWLEAVKYLIFRKE